MFEWGIAAHGLHSEHERAATGAEKSAITRVLIRKMAGQVGKDYVLFPALSLRRWRRTLTANVAANLLRNLWAYVVIVCGHFADGAEKFTPDAVEHETKPEWYLRQMLGTANFDAGPVLALLSGNLCYQIEHHLFPDLPSNRYAAIAPRVRAVCASYDLPYTTGPLVRQYLLTFRTISKLTLPDRLLTATSDDAPETASEHKFRNVDTLCEPSGGIGDTQRRGLVTAIRQLQIQRRSRRFLRPGDGVRHGRRESGVVVLSAECDCCRRRVAQRSPKPPGPANNLPTKATGRYLVHPGGFNDESLDGGHIHRLRTFRPLADLELDSLISSRERNPSPLISE